MPGREQTLDSALAQAARRWPDRPALWFDGAELSYAELESVVNRAAAGLTRLGLEKGDRLALMLPNCPFFAVSLLAAARLGAISVPVNPMLAPEEACFLLAHSGAKALVTLPPFVPAIEAIRGDLPDLRHVLTAEEELVGGSMDAAPPCASDPADTAVIFYTSGTTGRPKGAMLSHLNLLSNAGACAETFGVNERDRFCCVLPLFHSFGATVCLVLPVLAGARMTLVPRFAPRDLLALVGSERCTLLAGVPSMYALMLATTRQPDFVLASLRIVVSGGAPLPTEVQAAFSRRFDVELLEGYGPTEASPVVSVNRLGANRPGSVGLPLPGVEVRVVDGGGRDVATGEVGEILVRGPNVMQGYYREPEATAQTVRAGWLHTGDLGRVDEDGHLYIVDRKKDLVIVGGMNVYPRQVEDVLEQHPAVAEAAVFGARCDVRGECVAACVALREGHEAAEAALLAYCRGRLAAFKAPRRVFVCDELPRSATGKVLKRELRRRYADLVSRRQTRIETVS